MPIQKTAAITGHRPNKLFGYDLMAGPYQKLRAGIKQLLVQEDIRELYTGMALGTDMLAALAVIDLQNAGHDIRLHAAVPYKDHKDGRWPQETRDLYDAILSRAARVDLVTDGPYSPWALELRNRFMVDRSGLLARFSPALPAGPRTASNIPAGPANPSGSSTRSIRNSPRSFPVRKFKKESHQTCIKTPT